MFDTKFFPGAKMFWHMGQFHNWDSVNVHVMSHALHYGSSVFEGIRAYDTARGSAIFRLDDHLDRFFYSAKALNMDIPFSKEEIKQAIKSVMKENKLRAAYIRPNLYYGYGNLGLIPKACPVELSIGCWTWGAYLGEEGVEKGVHALLVPNLRVHISQMDTRAKVGGVYTQSTISGKYARDMGCDEAIFMNLEGRIAEGPGENILIVKGNLVKTNDENESVLPGITRSTILELAKDLGYDIDISPITLEEFLGADEACFAGTAAEVTPITRVTDGRNKKINKSEWPSYNIGQGKPGPIIRKLAKQYADLVRGENSQYDNWLTYVYDSNEEVEANLGKV